MDWQIVLKLKLDGTNWTEMATGVASGTMALERSIVKDDLAFGVPYSSMFKCQFYDISDDLNGVEIKVIKRSGSTDKSLFTGKINSSTTDYEGIYRDVVAYDAFFYLRDLNMAEDWDTFWSTRTSATVKTIREWICTTAGLSYRSRTLTNDNVSIPKTAAGTFTKLTFEDLVHAISEICAVFPVIDPDGYMDWVYVHTDTNVSPSGVLQLGDGTIETGASSYEDFSTALIDSIEVLDLESNIAWTIGSTHENAFKFVGNFLMMGMDETLINTVCGAILTKISTLSYNPCSVKLIYPIWAADLGLEMTTPHGNAFIMHMVFSGIQLVDEEIGADASAEYISQVTVNYNSAILTSTKFSRIEQDIDGITLEVGEAKAVTDEISGSGGGDYIVGRINLTSTTATIAAQHINLQGQVTITDLTTSLQNDINAIPTVNLLPNVYASDETHGNPWTTNGITFTVNDDGSVTATGTNTSTSAVAYYLVGTSIVSSVVKPLRIDPNNTYTLSGCPTGGTSSSYYMVIYYNNSGTGTWSNRQDYGNGVTIPSGYKYCYIRIVIAGSYAIVGSLTFYPMLTTGDAKKDFQWNGTYIDAGRIVTGYISADRIDANSITIGKLASDVTTPITNAQTTADAAVANMPVINLIPDTYYSQAVDGNPYTTTSGLTFTVNGDGSITVTGTNTSSSNVSYYLMGTNLSMIPAPLQIDPNKKYYVSGCPSGGSSSTYFLGIYRSTNGSSWASVVRDTGSGYTVAAGYNYIYVRIIIGGSYACPQDGLTFYPMITTGGSSYAYQRNATVIDGGHIVTGTLDASKVNVTNLNADNITSGALTIKDSSNRIYFQADATNKTVQICGFTVNQNSMMAGTYGTANSVMVCTGTAGSKSIGGSGSISGWAITAGANFGVTKAGALYASSATIQGSITATGGSIAGWTISGTRISSDNGNTYLDSDSGEFAFYTTSGGTFTEIAHNGNMITTGSIETSGSLIVSGSGKINLNNTSAAIQAFGTTIIEPASSAFVRFGYYGKNMMQFFNSTTGDGVYLTINGTTLKLRTSGTSPNMYIRAEVV